MMNLLASCVVVCCTLLITVPTTTATFINGLYTSNGTDILRVHQSGSQSAVTSVYKSDGGRIVGLAFSYSSNYVFWSDIGFGNRGIYRATTDSSGNINNAEKIVSDDVLEVNGLTVDWISSHIYWTDGRKRSVEVAEFNGSNHRILITEQLSQPRGIYADPISGYLFWNDQGYHQIERSRLDGSGRRIIVSNTTDDAYWPNQMTVVNSKLYWVESKYKTLHSSNVDGKSGSSVSLDGVVGNAHVYGLAVTGDNAYISCWKNSASVIKIQLPNGAPTVYNFGLSTGAVFSNVYISSQPTGNNPCDGKSCELCLPTSKTSARCSCPSYGGRVLKNNQCVEPSSVVLYTLSQSGYIGFYDPDATDNGDRYFVARSLRPVAVAYDPVNKNVYWSDVRERTIHRIRLDHTNRQLLLHSSRGIGVVDGMAVDHANRRLYYTNIGSMKVNQETYSWHKIETIRLDSLSTKIRTIVSSHADRPRAIAVDSTNGYLYYTDWGKTPSVVRTRLDGSNPTVIKKDLNNPNGIAVTGSKIYVTDSNYKTRFPPSARSAVDGSLYSMNLDGTNWVDELRSAGTKLKTPFGLTADGSGNLYVSDWDKNAIYKVDVSSNTPSLTEVVGGVFLPMAVQHTVVSATSSSDPCSSSSCNDICIKPSSSSSTQCTCNSYKNRRLNSGRCDVPESYLLVSDMNGVKMVGVDSSGDDSVYVASVGRPYFSNLVALAYDSTSNTAYYSDVRRKAIYALSLSNSTSAELYRINHIIDGLTLHDGKLYWTDSLIGRIASLDINAAQIEHKVLVTGLEKPRAIVVHDSYVYWTECGSKPRVARMRLSSSSIETVGPTDLKWPNALFVKENKLYIADGHPKGIRLLRCDLPLLSGVSNCENIAAVNSSTVAHMYDIYVTDSDILVYTDWKNKSVNMLSLTSGTQLKPLATGLMRPSQLLFVGNPDTSSCSLPCTNGQCVRFGNQQCVCSGGYTLTSNYSSCAATSSLSCTHNSNSYTLGSRNIKSSDCERCHCLANSLYAAAGQLTCHSVHCPVLDCPKFSIPDGECCRRCDDVCVNGVEITNCPSQPVRVSLPTSRDEVLYQFSPSTRDCDRLERYVTTTKTPQGDIYRWNSGTGYDVTIIAKVQGATDTCKFKVIPVDTTPPAIKCPGNIRVYTAAQKTTVVWPSPQVSDNVGVDADKVTSSPSYGSEFTVDTTTPVIYTATDRAGRNSSCTFNVQVEKQTGACTIPKLQRGRLLCSPTAGSFRCDVQCDARYILKPKTAHSQIDCSAGQWTPQIPDNFERFTCVRVVAGSVQGSISVTADNVCQGIEGTMNRDYTKEVLEYRIDVSYLPLSLRELTSTVDVGRCGGRRRRDASDDVMITVTIRGSYESKSERDSVRHEITYILLKIQEDLLKGFLVVPLRDDKRIWSAAIISGVGSVALEDIGCPQGSYSTDKGCILCPAGTHLSGKKCIPCEEGTYNNRDGQESCTACPDSRSKSPAGSNSIDQCEPDDELPIAMIIGIAVAAVLLIIIIIIIIVVVVCVKKRRRNRSGADAHKHQNPAFERDEYYDNINDNHYEAMNEKQPEPHYSVLHDE